MQGLKDSACHTGGCKSRLTMSFIYKVTISILVMAMLRSAFIDASFVIMKWVWKANKASYLSSFPARIALLATGNV